MVMLLVIVIVVDVVVSETVQIPLSFLVPKKKSISYAPAFCVPKLNEIELFCAIVEWDMYSYALWTLYVSCDENEQLFVGLVEFVVAVMGFVPQAAYTGILTKLPLFEMEENADKFTVTGTRQPSV